VLRKKFSGKPEYVVNYLFMVAEDARRIMAAWASAGWTT
jgi:glutamate synthase (NADPH) large chain